MAYQATKSKDGVLRYSVHLEYRVDKEMVDWICQKTGWGMQQTLGWVRQQIAAHDNYGWYKPYWNEKDKEMEWLSVDDISDAEKDSGGEGYESKK